MESVKVKLTCWNEYIRLFNKLNIKKNNQKEPLNWFFLAYKG